MADMKTRIAYELDNCGEKSNLSQLLHDIEEFIFNLELSNRESKTWYDALKQDFDAQEAEIKRLREALQSVDDLWGGEEGLCKEMLACKELDCDSPVYIVWRKIKAALKGE